MQYSLKREIGRFYRLWTEIVRRLRIEVAVVRLNFQVFENFGHIGPKRQLLYCRFALNSQQTQQNVASQISIPKFFRLDFGLFFDLEADNLLIGLFLPIGVVCKYLLLKSGDVII